MQAAAELERTIDTHDTLSPGPVGAPREIAGELLLKGGSAREGPGIIRGIATKLAEHDTAATLKTAAR